mmetsp:Transcript_9563/g.13360  ORF Transcript_9563/g.13360 Transcript_9563/m.13360 type:complete len:263 (+) Transcript_9563:1861-2649(+)
METTITNTSRKLPFPITKSRKTSSSRRLLKCMSQNIHIVQTCSCVSITLPCSSSSTASSLPSIHNVCHASIVILKYSPVVQFFLCVRSIDWVGNVCVVHLSICNLCSNLPLQQRYPIFANTFTLHCLGTPKDGTRYFMTIFICTFKHISQIRLFASWGVGLYCLLVYHLEGRIKTHGHCSELGVKEGNTSLQTMRHCHTISPMKIDITKHTINPSKFILYLSGTLSIHKVEISRKKLICTFTSKNHLYIRPCSFCKKPVGDG